MGTPKEHGPVLLFVGAILTDAGIEPDVRKALAGEFGEIDAESPLFPFTHTEYYTDEMERELLKKFYAFRELIDPARIVEAKLRTDELERELFSTGDNPPRRRVNLDPGYISLSHLVLATTKNHAHRVYLRDGIYAEVTLRFHRGAFRPWEWTYPDYRTPEYIGFFNESRLRYRELLRYE
ncbi:MAG: DUF4416 family protein [bacterium]